MGIATAAIGAGTGIYQIVSANSQKQKAQRQIDDFKYSELTNAYENMQVSKLGAEIILEASGAATAQSVDALQKAGVNVLTYGNFITIVLNFLILMWVVFLLVKFLNRIRKPEDAVDTTPADIELLREIRDELKNRPK